MYSRLIGAGHTKLKNAVQDIEDRHKDILNLEKVEIYNFISLLFFIIRVLIKFINCFLI